jgi:hypothetical protein
VLASWHRLSWWDLALHACVPTLPSPAGPAPRCPGDSGILGVLAARSHPPARIAQRTRPLRLRFSTSARLCARLPPLPRPLPLFLALVVVLSNPTQPALPLRNPPPGKTRGFPFREFPLPRTAVRIPRESSLSSSTSRLACTGIPPTTALSRGFPPPEPPKKRSAPIPLSRRDPSTAGSPPGGPLPAPLPPAPLPPAPLPAETLRAGRNPRLARHAVPFFSGPPERPPPAPTHSLPLTPPTRCPRRSTHGPTSLHRPPSARQGSFPHPPSRGSSGRREGRCLDVDWRGACERGKRFAFVAREFNFAGGLRAGFCCREDFHGNKTSNIDSYL